MTPEQVAEYLQLNKDTVHRLIRDKRMAATRIGRSYRIPREDLEAFLVANSTREAVRQALFRRVISDGGTKPGRGFGRGPGRTGANEAAQSQIPQERVTVVLDFNVVVAAVIAPRGLTRQVLSYWEASPFVAEGMSTRSLILNPSELATS